MKTYSSCKITIGTRATRVPNPTADLTHEWVAYVKAPKDVVKCVQWKLHESFTNNTLITEFPFELREKGWGEFIIQLKIILYNDDRVTTSHFLKLHGEGDVVISESHDELVYRGIESTTKPTEEEEEEYKKIDNAINHMLRLFKEIEF
ncbi:Protein AF-9 like protein [Nosema granulosis]|uniref:Protein AF-9 homolog n=1 Tax=Nosema granulosis TaxID=83296 RepID=A0A9P6GY90_9MICR|nr:Protein AF-9 like protein [Nosema granulosis]